MSTYEYPRNYVKIGYFLIVSPFPFLAQCVCVIRIVLLKKNLPFLYNILLFLVVHTNKIMNIYAVFRTQNLITYVPCSILYIWKNDFVGREK